MKKFYTILVSLIIFISIFFAKNCEAQWVQISNGMGNTIEVTCIASVGSNLFAGGYNMSTYTGSIWRSTNNGDLWSQTAFYSPNYINSLIVNNNILFVGTQYNGVYISTNYGTSWSQTSLNNHSVFSLVAQGNYVYAGTGNGLYITTNFGTNWSVNNTMEWIYTLAISGNKIFAGTSQDGVYLSTNNGLNWNSIGLNLGLEVYSLTANGDYIFAGLRLSGVYVSTNLGLNWTQTPLNNNDIHSLLSQGSNIIAGTYWTYNNIYASSNNGLNWSLFNQGFNNNPVTIETFHISNNYIFAGTIGRSVYRLPLIEFVNIKNISSEIPLKYSLSQNYPNPFNPTTNIKFAVARVGDVKIVVYDVTGREVQTLVNESIKPGTYETTFDGSMLNSGVYFYKITAGEFSETRKMLLIK